MLTGVWAKLRENGADRRITEVYPASAKPNRSANDKAAIDPRTSRRKRIGILLWAFVIALICGAIDFGRPLEDLIQAGRDTIRSQPAPQDIAVVAIDDKTIKQLGGIEFPRRFFAKAIDNAFAAGAKDIYFDTAFSAEGGAVDDALLAAAFDRNRGKVFAGMLRAKDQSGSSELFLPNPALRASVGLVSLSSKSSPFQISATVPYSDAGPKTRVPAMSAKIAGVNRLDGSSYRPDFSFDLRTIPTISMIDLVDTNKIQRLQGKTLVFGFTTSSGNDIHHVAAHGWWPGVYFHVAGAHTLKSGDPVNLGWLPAFFVSLIAALYMASRCSDSQFFGVAVVVFAILIALPLVADAWLWTVEIVPALLMLVIATFRLRAVRNMERTSATNRSSGLPHVNLLRDRQTTSAATLVCLRIGNYADIDASFRNSVEKELIAEVCRRLRAVGIAGDIHHSEDILAWFMPAAQDKELEGHFEGLKSILIAPVAIGARRVDVLISFGADSDYGSPVSSRIGSAILSAAEAAESLLLWKHYVPERRDNADWELSLLGRLDDGIDNGEVWVAFQPQYDFTKKCVIGAEALVRWDHPDRGPINPEEFILAAERNNRIDKLTWFVLDRAIAAAAGINRRGVEFTISVNLSAVVLRSPRLLSCVRDILGRHDFPAGKLVLELTETGRISDMTAALDQLHALSRMGIKLSIDDYGTGFASLDYFRVIPATEIKIDRRFISNLRPGASEMVLVASTIAMAHSMGCTVVAEGIEKQNEFDILAMSGCDLGQGYLIGKPMTPDMLVEAILPARLRRKA